MAKGNQVGKEEEDLDFTVQDAIALAGAVKRIDKAMKALAQSGLNRRGLIALLQVSTKVPQRDIRKVLDGLSDLGDRYLERSS